MSSSEWTWDVEALPDAISVPDIEILDKLGQGGMGEVYRGRDGTGREVAVKILRGMDARSQDRFEREAELLARFKAPEIVGAHAWGRTRELSYLVCELIEGQDLCGATEPLDLPARLDLFLEVARAVGVAHRAGVVHRDLKPSNILIDEGGRVRLIDFGLSIGLDQERLTRTNQLVGTPAYLPPERLASSDPLPANDVWSLGAIAYELVTNAVPYPAETLDQLIQRFSPPPTISAPVPRAVKAVIRKALDPVPAQRYVDADAFAAALADALAQPPEARARWAGAVALAGGAVVIVGFALVQRAGDATPPRSSPAPLPAMSVAPTPLASTPTAPQARATWPLPLPASATLTWRERKKLGKISDLGAARHLAFLKGLQARGDPDAMRLIGLLRIIGTPSLPRDRRLGHALLIRALKYGCRAAGSDLAMLYVSGIPLPAGLELMTYRDHGRALALPDNPRLATALAFLGKTSKPPRGTASSTQLLTFLVSKHNVVAPRSREEAYAIAQRELEP